MSGRVSSREATEAYLLGVVTVLLTRPGGGVRLQEAVPGASSVVLQVDSGRFIRVRVEDLGADWSPGAEAERAELERLRDVGKAPPDPSPDPVDGPVTYTEDAVHGIRTGLPRERVPYVGRGVDGALRSAEMDRQEADTWPLESGRREECLQSARAWEAQAEALRRVV